MTPSMLRNQLSDSFNKNELRSLCFDLSIKYENLRGETLDDKSRELIEHCVRYGKLGDLLGYCRISRPHLEWDYEIDRPRKEQSFELELAPSQITTYSSKAKQSENSQKIFLAGLLIDFSRLMLTNLATTQNQNSQSSAKVQQAIEIILEKVRSLNKTPELDKVLPRFKLFAYGYGFGKIRKGLLDFLDRIGVGSINTDSQDIITSPVRDLFSEANKRYGLPITPNAPELDSDFGAYQKSLEAQFLDMGMGSPNLLDGLYTVSNRFQEEIKVKQINNAVLFLISTGHADEAQEEQIKFLANDLRSTGIILVCCYVGAENFTVSKKLYLEEETHWPAEAIKLFNYSSVVSSEQQISLNLIEEAKEYGWEIPEGSRLFIHLNNTNQLSELLDFILNSVME